MTYEEIKERGLERYFAKPGDICQRLSDGKYVKISEDGHPVLLTEEKLNMYMKNGVIQTKTSNPYSEFDGDVLCTIPLTKPRPCTMPNFRAYLDIRDGKTRKGWKRK